MGKKIESIFVRYYRSGVLVTVLCSLLVFGVIAWNVSANSRQNTADNKPTGAPTAEKSLSSGS